MSTRRSVGRYIYQPKVHHTTKVAGCSDTLLLDLCRQVVRREWGGMCAFRGLLDSQDCEGSVEWHHVKRRRIPHLRYCPTNGVLLCQFHHGKIKYRTWHRRLEEIIGEYKMEWLDAQEQKLFPDFLAEKEMTRAEWRRSQKQYLQTLLERGES